MAVITTNSWIPRSYVHVNEVFKNASAGKLPLKINSLNLGNTVSFNIEFFKGFKDIKFSLDGDGLYSFTAEISDKDAVTAGRKYLEAVHELLLEIIIKICHSVTYEQIKRQIILLNFHTIVYLKNLPELKNYEKISSGSLKLILNRREESFTDSFLFINSAYSPDTAKILNNYSFVSIVEHFLYGMMDKMSEYYKKSGRTIPLLKGHDTGLADLKDVILGLDMLEKDVTETKSKISQLVDSLERKHAEFEVIKNTKLASALGLEMKYKTAYADKEYLASLWELLLGYLEKIDSSVEARMSWQESLESRRLEAFMSIEATSILAALIVGIIFVTPENIAENWALLLMFLVVWFIFYKAVLWSAGRSMRKKIVL